MLFSYSIEIARKPARADHAVSKNKTDDEIGSSTVTLSEAKGLSRWAARCFAAAQHDGIDMHTAFSCHPERSEGSVALGREMLRCAQHGSVVTNTDARINLLHWIIRTYEGPDYFVNQPNPT
jgi:hypothetical protein